MFTSTFISARSPVWLLEGEVALETLLQVRHNEGLRGPVGLPFLAASFLAPRDAPTFFCFLLLPRWLSLLVPRLL